MVSIYGHLSEIAPGLQAGNTVRIGEVIGRVGSSGLSTGSHLHFAIEKNGQFVNPLTASLGTHNKVPQEMRALFDRLKQRYVAALDRMPQFGGHFSLPFSVSHSAIAGAGNGAGVSAATSRTTSERAATVRTIANEHSGLRAR